MAVSWTAHVDADDDGVWETGENLSANVARIWIRVGVRPYEFVEDPDWTGAEIEVTNFDESLSPESSSYDLHRGTPLRVQSNDGVTTRTMFLGFVQDVERIDENRLLLRAKTAAAQLLVNVRLPVQQSQAAGVIVGAVLDRVPLRWAVQAGYAWVGDSTLVGESTLVLGDPFTRSLETGDYTFTFAGEGWGVGVTALEAIRQVMQVEAGRFYTSRAGTVTLLERGTVLGVASLAATVSDSMADFEYVSDEQIVSEVEVEVEPRYVGSSATLWQIDRAYKLEPGVVRVVRAVFRDADKRLIGLQSLDWASSRNSFVANSASDGTGSDRTAYLEVVFLDVPVATAVAASALDVEFHNNTNTVIYVTTGTIIGTPLYRADRVVVRAEDLSTRRYAGAFSLRIDAPLMNELEDAQNLAGYELGRRAVFHGEVASVKLAAAMSEADMLARSVGDRVRVVNGRLNHDAEYRIEAEEHHVTPERYEVVWHLEAAPDERWAFVGIALVGEDTLVGY